MISTTYLISALGTDLYKIGVTSQTAKERCKNLQTGCPHELSVMATVKTPWAEEIEDELHSDLSEHRESGEWFRLEKSQLSHVLDVFRQRERQFVFAQIDALNRTISAGSFTSRERNAFVLLTGMFEDYCAQDDPKSDRLDSLYTFVVNNWFSESHTVSWAENQLEKLRFDPSDVEYGDLFGPPATK